MTEPETGLAEARVPPVPLLPFDEPRAPRRNAARRLVEWLWSGEAMEALERALPVQLARELERRARLSLELGQLAAEKVFENGSADAIACELYRQAVYWALLASVPALHERATLDEKLGVSSPTIDELWKEVEPSFLARAAGGEPEAGAVGDRIRQASFVQIAELPASARADLTATLRRLAKNLVAELDTAQSEVDRIWMRRVARTGSLFLLAVLMVAVPLLVSSRLDERRDLARGRPWTVSSRLQEFGCTSPRQSCPESPDYFFHTVEEDNPWLMIDLEATRTVSAIHVQNRADCCAERAVPLVVETSLDKKSWQRVARRTEEFTDWKPTFAPTAARFVRLTVPRRTLLHLQTVRVLP